MGRYFDRINILEGWMHQVFSVTTLTCMLRTSQPTNVREKKPMCTTIGIKGYTHTYIYLQDEIFAPLLPIYRYTDLQEAVDFINAGEKPLAMYVRVCMLMYATRTPASAIRPPNASRCMLSCIHQDIEPFFVSPTFSRSPFLCGYTQPFPPASLCHTFTTAA